MLRTELLRLRYEQVIGCGNKRRVLILCTGNSARSQIAEGMLRNLSNGRYEVFSAGTTPAALNPLAVEAMLEMGIDISEQRSKSAAEFAEKTFDTVITVCDSAAEQCPVFPGAPQRVHWSLPDPAAVAGTHEERLRAFRGVRDELLGRIRSFVGSAVSEMRS